VGGGRDTDDGDQATVVLRYNVRYKKYSNISDISLE